MSDLSAGGASSLSASETPPADPQSVPADEAVPDFRKHKHKLKVNDKELDLDYDEVIRRAQKASAADEVFRKSSAKEKQIAALFDRMKAGDLDWIEEIAGDKAREWAEKRLLKHIEYQEMSQEKKDWLAEKARADKLEKENMTRKEREEAEQSEHYRNQVSQDLDTSITEAFRSTSLPMTPGRLERVAQVMAASLETQGTLLDPVKAIALVNKQMRSDALEVLSGMSPEDLKGFLPKKFLDGLRRSDLEDVRSQDPMRKRLPQEVDQKRVTNGKQRRMSTDKYFEQLEKRLGR